jgi:hypothetical protein
MSSLFAAAVAPAPDTPLQVGWRGPKTPCGRVAVLSELGDAEGAILPGISQALEPYG